MKLFWLRSAFIVAAEYLVFIRAETPLALMPLAFASAANAFFQLSKPAELLPHLAACATPIVMAAAATNAASPHAFLLIILLTPHDCPPLKHAQIATKRRLCHRPEELRVSRSR